ncbi:tetratricopeptide repeat protein [Duganella sp. PWIR1]
MLAVRRAIRSIASCLHCDPVVFIAGALKLAGPAPYTSVTALPYWKQRKLALLADATCVTPAALQQWADKDMQTAALFGIVALDDEPMEAERAASLNHLAEWVVHLPPVDFFPGMLQQLQMSAFAVSYLNTDAKHRAKRAIVAQASHMLRQIVPRPAAIVPAAVKPRLTVVSELFFPQHAMYRCYAEAIAELQTRFHVTLLADLPTRCPEHATIADEVSYFPPEERDVAVLAQLVQASRPDVILYPSVGMCLWTFSLSLLRLAPLQLASVGHPSPVCSDTIDGTVVFDKLLPDPSEGYGTLITYGRQPLPVPPAGSRVQDAQDVGTAPVIGVNAAFMKLNADFLDMVGQIQAAAPAGTTLRFFPNLRGGAKVAFESRLKQKFPDALVFETTSYADYMRELGECSLVLQSFPFGGTNTAMDALSLGVPLLCYKGRDLSALVDPLLLETAGLAELCTTSHADYRDTAVRLLHDAVGLAQLALRVKQAFALLDVAAKTGGSSMADAIYDAWSARSGA